MNEPNAIPTPKHPHDMPEDVLQQLLGSIARPDILKELAKLSRDAFGFFNRLEVMVTDYLWMAEQLEHFEAGARMLDIGAGVGPIPLWLAARGHRVDCVDNSPIIRKLPAAANWNEWGAFDYGTLSENLTAHYCDINEFQPTHVYDAIYSISSLPCVGPRSKWEDALRLARRSLRPGGQLSLSVGLIHNTNFMYNEGHYGGRYGVIEPLSEHGTSLDLEQHIVDLGFVVHNIKIRRGVPNSPVDHLFINCGA